MNSVQSLSSIEAAFRRAARNAGSEVDCPSFEAAFQLELDRLMAGEVLDELHKQGVAEVVRVDSDGERVWGLTAVRELAVA